MKHEGSNHLKCSRALSHKSSALEIPLVIMGALGPGAREAPGLGKTRDSLSFGRKDTTHRRHWRTKLSFMLSLLSSAGQQDTRTPMCCTKLYRRTKTLVSSQGENIHANVTNTKTSVEMRFSCTE